jgi:hypothetical protein
MIFSKPKPASGCHNLPRNAGIARVSHPTTQMKIIHLTLPCFIVLLSSCASVSVKGEHRSAKQPVQKPAKIYVADFDTSKGSYKIGGEPGKNPEAFKKKTAETLAAYVVKGIDNHVAPAERTGSVSKLPKVGWLVAGEFVRVNTGSRILRAGVGLGAGGSKMETRVRIFDLASGTEPFLTFETTGGSNAMPGLITNPGTTAAISMTTQAMMGVTDDAARTSRMITGELNEYLIAHGWLPKSKLYSAKKSGQYRLVHQQYTQ